MKPLKNKKTAARRGVLLLVVLAMLVMFGLFAFAFVMLTGHAKRISTAENRKDSVIDPYEPVADQTLHLLLRGSDSTGTAGPSISLLEDMYGDGSTSGTITASTGVQSVRGGQLINLAVTGVADPETRVGCVLTMLNGPAAGHSTRIVGYSASGAYQYQIAAFESVATSDLVTYNVTNANAIGFIINGGDFSGTGTGYNSSTGMLDYNIQNWGNSDLPLSLLLRPFFSNQEYLLWKAGPDGIAGNTDDRALPLWRANEDYDAVDHQNPLLSLQIGEGAGADRVVRTAIPSLHRPELVRYWAARPGMMSPAPDFSSIGPTFTTFMDDFARRDLARRIILRPLPDDHFFDANDNGSCDGTEFFFTGSNPAFTGTNFSQRYLSGFNPLWDYATSVGTEFGYDVDTDGDGAPDSYWMDFGFSARALPDGRLYKPLVAVQVVDMDGRLNLNAHGTYSQTFDDYYGDPSQAAASHRAPKDFYSPIATVAGTNYGFAGAAAAAIEQVRGFGYGPADVNLDKLFGARADYRNFLLARYASSGATATANELPGRIADGDDPLHYNKWYEYGGDYRGASVNDAGAFGSPPNRLADGVIGLDHAGRPIYGRMGRAEAAAGAGLPPANRNHEKWCDPYRMNLFDRTAADSPFKPVELERLLRPFDRDASRLTSRLTSYISHTQRDVVTTESYHVPTASFLLPNHLANYVNSGISACSVAANQAWLRSLIPGRTMQDVLYARAFAAERDRGTAADAAVTNARNISANALTKLLPIETLLRLRMNVNRPFGNDRDNNGNNVVDEPGEVLGNMVYKNAAGVDVTVACSPVGNVDVNNDGLVNATDQMMARQLYARYLYIMMMINVDTRGLSQANRAIVAKQAAQWAVNAVDFRDRDAIMTPFEYDIEPFVDNSTTPDGNPWDVDGIVQADPATEDDATAAAADKWRGLVWGCERPELLITETLAFHDRRTQNTNTDNGEGEYVGSGGETDFDQVIKPQGSMFLEFHNPSSSLDPAPLELYGSSGGNFGVQLDRTTPSGWPVWRVLIVVEDDDSTKPQWQRDPDTTSTTATDIPVVYRSIYFANTPALTSLTGDGSVRFFPAGAVSAVPQGQYAVIGPRPVTYIGWRDNAGTPVQDGSTRQINLGAGAGLSPVLNNNMNEPAAGQIRTVVPIVIDQTGTPGSSTQRGLNISEPDPGSANDYPPYDFPPSPGTPTEYGPSRDTPFDAEDRGLPARIATAVKAQGGIESTSGTRVAMVYLQRLANPLLDHNPSQNPYRTIDSSPVDLFAFNGRQNDTSDGWLQSSIDTFQANQRGESNEPAVDGVNNVWIQRMDRTKTFTADTGADLDSTHVFQHKLRHSLGFLNVPFHPYRIVAPNLGDPADTPFPWLTWPNRPLVNAMELMLVPAASSSLLLNRALQEDPALPRAFGIAASGNPYQIDNLPYPHLLSFFHSGWDGATAQPPYPPSRHRIFDYLGVPSPFMGAETMLDPTTFDVAGENFRPPLNRLPRYRDPGKVNLNTIADEAVWNGLMNDFPLGVSNFFLGNFIRSRRGYPGSTASVKDAICSLNNDYPTRFANPFRGSAGYYLVPPTGTAAEGVSLSKGETMTGLLRSQHPGATDPSEPLLARNSGIAATNDDRNPFFRYQAINRLENLVTTRSNVYGVWITIGYFEVQPRPKRFLANGTTEWSADQYKAIYPDGYALGPELGMDTGEINRHRAFYLIDRSIPVAFERGKDHNVEKAILVKRYIE